MSHAKKYKKLKENMKILIDKMHDLEKDKETETVKNKLQNLNTLLKFNIMVATILLKKIKEEEKDDSGSESSDSEFDD